MNLIEKLGLEKCKQIVDGAPEGAEYWRDMDSVCSPNEILHYRWFAGALIVHDAEKGWIKSIYHDGCEYILDQLQDLKDLRTAIANHTDNLSHFDHKKCHHEWNETTSNGDAYRFFVCKNCDSTKNYVPFETDHCSDIANHISPLTKVTER